MKKCKYLKSEKCVGCGLCEPVINLTEEISEAFVDAIKQSKEFNDMRTKH